MEVFVIIAERQPHLQNKVMCAEESCYPSLEIKNIHNRWQRL
jgi:hypothetical protein